MDDREMRLRRLRLRAWRRGIRELDLLIGPFADTQASDLSEEELATMERALSENDTDLYDWIIGRASPPPEYVGFLATIRAFHERR